MAIRTWKEENRGEPTSFGRSVLQKWVLSWLAWFQIAYNVSWCASCVGLGVALLLNMSKKEMPSFLKQNCNKLRRKSIEKHLQLTPLYHFRMCCIKILEVQCTNMYRSYWKRNMFFFTLPEGKSVEKDPPQKKRKGVPCIGNVGMSSWKAWMFRHTWRQCSQWVPWVKIDESRLLRPTYHAHTAAYNVTITSN